MLVIYILANVKRALSILFALIAFASAHAQTVTGTPAQTQVPDNDTVLIQFSGFVLTADSLMGVPFAHITVLNRGRVATAGPDGFFSFAAHRGDTLYFTSVGYKPSVYVIPRNMPGDKYSVIQLMTSTDYYIREAIIYPWSDFRQAFLELRLPDDDLDRARRNLERERLAELGEKLDIDGAEASKNYIRSNSAKTYYFRQAPQQNLFNPLAWAEFIKAWKRGDFKKKD